MAVCDALKALFGIDLKGVEEGAILDYWRGDRIKKACYLI